MRALPVSIGPIHFVGIGGIGMSGIAEVLLSMGYRVQGSDAKENDRTRSLAEQGAVIRIGQKAENLERAEVVVISSAIKPGNPELDDNKLQRVTFYTRTLAVPARRISPRRRATTSSRLNGLVT